MYTATLLSSIYTGTPKVKVTQVLEYKIGLVNTWTNRILDLTTVHGYFYKIISEIDYLVCWYILSDDLGHLRILVYVVIV